MHSLQLIMEENKSLYIHIPFCRNKCHYCDFFSKGYSDELASRYIDTLSLEISHLEGKFSTIFIGGGTPSVLEERLIKNLLESVNKLVDSNTEFTFEANPESLDKDKIGLLLDKGVNRLSIGIQSFNDKKLRKLGRIHSAIEAREAIENAWKMGFKNINADFIYGVWDETFEEWDWDLREALKLPLKHISCYLLTYEENTPLGLNLKDKKITPLQEEKVTDMYEYAMSFLSKNGFLHYEVSNFAKEGFECRHNLNYWENNPYYAFGPSAVSYLNGARSKNISNIEEYIECVQMGKSTVASTEKLDFLKKAKETAAIKIRTRNGINPSWFKTKTSFDLFNLEESTLTSLRDKGLIEICARNGSAKEVRLTKKGFLFCDTVSSELL